MARKKKSDPITVILALLILVVLCVFIFFGIKYAYEKLILDAMQGRASNFAHWKELQCSWKFVDAIRQAWDQNVDQVAFPNYDCASMGPKASDDLLAKDGNHWEFNC